MLKKIGAIVLSICLLVPTSSVFASDNSNSSKTNIDNEVTNYWSEKFDTFNEELNNGNLGDLVGTSELYIKFTPKNEDIDLKNATEDDFNKEVFDREGYEKELFNKNSRYIGPFDPNGTCSWLRLDLQVYETSTSGLYSAISFWEWKTVPQFRFKDINGIYVSSEFIIGNETAGASKVAEFRYREANSGTWTFENPNVEISQFGNGAAASINLPGDSSLFTHDLFMGMLMVPVKFSNTGSTDGRIYTSYSHTRVSLGDISFDSEGKPGFGLTSKIDEFSGSVYVAK